MDQITGTQIGGNRTLDVDGNNSIDALTDGLMILRAILLVASYDRLRGGKCA